MSAFSVSDLKADSVFSPAAAFPLQSRHRHGASRHNFYLRSSLPFYLTRQAFCPVLFPLTYPGIVSALRAKFLFHA